MPLRFLSENGPGVLLYHHAGKNNTGSRGATEVRGFVDQIADLELTTPADPACRERRFIVRGRLTSSPERLTISLNEEGDDYQVVKGTLKPVRSELWAVMEALAPREPPGWTLADFRACWPEDQPCPSGDALRVMVHRYAAKAGWVRVDGRPPTYYKPAERRNEKPDTSVSGLCYAQAVTPPSAN